MARWSLQPTSPAQATVLLIPTAFGQDTQAPATILSAGSTLSGFEPLLEVDVDELAVGQLPALLDEPPYSMCEAAVQQSLSRRQWPVLLPSVMGASWGAIRAAWKADQNLSVVHFSAHANLMNSPEIYDDNPSYGPGNWLEQVTQHQVQVVEVGVRSCSTKAWKFLKTSSQPTCTVFWAQQAWSSSEILSVLPQQPLFLTIDCSVLDPAVIPTVAYPEPGGVAWDKLLQTSLDLFAARPIVGLALGGLSVANGTKQAARPLARMLNWLLACHSLYPGQVMVRP